MNTPKDRTSWIKAEIFSKKNFGHLIKIHQNYNPDILLFNQGFTKEKLF